MSKQDEWVYEVEGLNGIVVNAVIEMVGRIGEVSHFDLKRIAKDTLSFSRISGKRLTHIKGLIDNSMLVSSVSDADRWVMSGEGVKAYGTKWIKSLPGLPEMDLTVDDDEEVAVQPLDTRIKPGPVEKMEESVKEDPPTEKTRNPAIPSQSQMGRLLSAKLISKSEENGVSASYLFHYCPHCNGEVKVEASVTIGK